MERLILVKSGVTQERNLSLSELMQPLGILYIVNNSI